MPRALLAACTTCGPVRRAVRPAGALWAALLVASVAGAQPAPHADRYADAYEAYVQAACPIGEDRIRHFVYFARDRHAIRDHPFLAHDRFEGAQIMYPWAELEGAEGEYDFSAIEEDYAYLRAHGKQLFVQLQDATFTPDYRGVPEYLGGGAYDGGAVQQRNDAGVPTGWVAKRWNRRVRERFASLLDALGAQFDGRIEGINLQETAIGVDASRDRTFSPEAYADAVRATMRALREAFPTSTTLQYANFMPGEWLPWEDEGYLRSVYQHGEAIGVGLGAPDLLIRRRGQLNHALAMMHEGTYTVPLGIAVQDGNYVGWTGADASSEPPDARAAGPNLVPLLHAFAADFLRVDYMFWVDQAPYFEAHVLACFQN